MTRARSVTCSCLFQEPGEVNPQKPSRHLNAWLGNQADQRGASRMRARETRSTSKQLISSKTSNPGINEERSVPVELIQSQDRPYLSTHTRPKEQNTKNSIFVPSLPLSIRHNQTPRPISSLRSSVAVRLCGRWRREIHAPFQILKSLVFS